MPTRFVIRGILLTALVALTACAQDRSDLEQFIAEVKSRKTRTIEPIPQIQPYEAFTYRADGRRNPFVKIEPERDDRSGGPASDGVSPDFTRNSEPLEEFPIDSLRMVGTISLRGVRFALIRAPDGVIHRVQPGNYMGQNFGRIEYITETEIGLTEIIPDGFGGWMERPATVALSET